VFATSRAVCLVALAMHAHRAGSPLGRAVGSFDGFWYGLVSAHGYPSVLPLDRHGLVSRNPTAFFPAFPLLTRPLTSAGMPFWGAALVVNTLAGAAAALCIAAITRRYYVGRAERSGVAKWDGGAEPASRADRADRAALVTAALWCTLPAAYVLSMAYSEAVFTAFAAGCLLAISAERWLWAGVLAALAGATRPTGVILAAVCLVAAVAAAWRRRSVVPLVAPLLAPLGTAGYLGYLWLRLGRTDAWFITEREGWHTYTDFGAANARRAGRTLAAVRDHIATARRPAELYVIVVAAVTVLLLLALLWDRPPVHLLAYAGAVVALTLATRNVYSSVPRMLLPAFPVLIPLGGRLARLWWPVSALVVLVALAGSGFAAYVALRDPGFGP